MTMPGATRSDDPFGVLRRVMQPRPVAPPGEACEMCGETVPDAHSHVASVTERRLMCACRACYLLFTQRGAAGQRLRAVPERVMVAADFAFTQRQWDELSIPVGLVFFLRQTELNSASSDGSRSVTACYPSPAGATESELDLREWQQIIDDNPALSDVEDDVEAVLVRRRGSGEFECLIVPIDVCYALVGVVRRYWTGLQGGDEIWARIDEFFADLHRRAGRSG